MCMCMCSVCTPMMYVPPPPSPQKKHSHQQRKRLNIEYRLSITITFIIRVPPWVLLDYAYCGIMVNNDNGRRFVNGESTDMDIVLRDFELSCLLSLLFSFLYFFKNSTLICCAVDIPKLDLYNIFFLNFFFFFFFFLPFLAHESSIHDERLDGTTGSKIMRCVHMAKHSHKKISNMVKRAVFRDVPEPIAHCTIKLRLGDEPNGRKSFWRTRVAAKFDRARHIGIDAPL